MKKNILVVVLFAVVLSYQPAHAQKSTEKDAMTFGLVKRLNNLIKKDDDESKAALLKEADSMAKSKNEETLSFTAKLYRSIGQTEKAKQLENSIGRKFPEGIKARSEAFSKIFESKLNLTGVQLEAEHGKWMSQFPEKLFKEKDRAIYATALLSLALQFAKENNIDKVNHYLTSLEQNPNYIAAVALVCSELLKQGQHVAALGYLEDAYQITQVSNAGRNNIKARDVDSIALLFGQALLVNEQTTKAIEVLTKAYASDPSDETLLSLSKALTEQGKDLDAFLLLNGHMIQFGKNEKIINTISLIYSRLNNQKGDFGSFEAALDKQIKEALVIRYKTEMIKKAAPAFSLVNLEGKTVRLADLKGKVVVLDFWATWCPPCVASFPGMQAAVNHYKNDSEVMFLFINTAERVKDYVDTVQEFLKKSKYEFNVLFDEMKVRDRSTAVAYGVNAIPAKIIIDKEGFIRFESSVGNTDVAKLLNEIITKIELIKKG